jgi:hypothetical protein
MDKPGILHSLRELTNSREIPLMPLLDKSSRLSEYEPINEYILNLKNGSKPESASENLLRSVVTDILGLRLQPQLNVVSGFVDFAVMEGGTEPVLIELKALFDLYSDERLTSHPLKPASHLDQIKNYLHKHEYVILTDLRDAYLYNARDTFVDDKHFAHIPFAELLERAAQTRSLLDVLRRAEDEVDRPELDRVFFEDLQGWFTRFREVKFTDSDGAAELVILLINKLIFAKTLEDFGLVPFRFIQEEYERQKEKWVAKGSVPTLRSFFREFEEFFDDHYDTELFEEKLWDHLDKSQENLDIFARALDDVLGVSTWNKVFSRGIVHYNYRKINEDIFGKSYEMFLAANRKDEGIYYTPAPITTPMADSLVDALFLPLVDRIVKLLAIDRHDFAAADALMKQLYEIRVVDMAGGSGGFLIKVLRAIWEQYRRIDSACSWAKQSGQGLFDVPPEVRAAADFCHRHLLRDNQHRQLVADILLRHIWCVDKDPGAIEVAKTNVWKEAVKLTPADYNFRELKTEAAKILPNLELNFICNDSLVDADTDAQVSWLSTTGREAIAQLSALRNQYIANPSDHDPLEKALEVRREIRQILISHFAAEKLPCEPLLAALSFFPCYFTADGKARPAADRGFDGNIGNPPWETVKPIRKEFAGQHKYQMEGQQFDKWFETQLLENERFRQRWDEYQERHERYREHLTRTFKSQGSGDWNFYKLFIENNLRLLKHRGRLAMLVPSGIQTDEGCRDLRELLSIKNTLQDLTSFENKGYEREVDGVKRRLKIFPNVHPQFKFGYFNVLKGDIPGPDHTFNARFYLHDPAEIASPPIKYSVEMVRRFSPENLSIMEFRTPTDCQVCTKIRAAHPLLGSLGYQFRRELHLTGDNRFLRKIGTHKLKAGEIPLLEGKTTFQFDSKFTPPNWYVVEKEVREELLRKELYRLVSFVRKTKAKRVEGINVDDTSTNLEAELQEVFLRKKFSLHYQFERLAYREVGSSTNERTLIAAMLPARVCLSHKLMYLTPYKYEVDGKGRLTQAVWAEAELLPLLAMFNSLVLNYYVRNKVSTGVSVFQLYELPIPKLPNKARAKLVAAAEKLSASPHDTKERAELEALIAKEVYDLNIDDWRHLTGTFTFGSGDSKGELDEIIARSYELW